MRWPCGRWSRTRTTAPGGATAWRIDRSTNWTISGLTSRSSASASQVSARKAESRDRHGCRRLQHLVEQMERVVRRLVPPAAPCPAFQLHLLGTLNESLEMASSRDAGAGSATDRLSSSVTAKALPPYSVPLTTRSPSRVPHDRVRHPWVRVRCASREVGEVDFSGPGLRTGRKADGD